MSEVKKVLCIHSIVIGIQLFFITWCSLESSYALALHNNTLTLSEVPHYFQMEGQIEESCLKLSPMSARLSVMLVVHIVSFIILHVTVVLDYYSTRFPVRFQDAFKLVQLLESIFLIVFWITMIIFGLFYMNCFFNLIQADENLVGFVKHAGAAEGRTACKKVSQTFLVSSFYLGTYISLAFIIVAALLISCVLRLQNVYHENKTFDVLQKRLEKILKDYPSFKESKLQAFYKNNEKDLARFPLFDIEVDIFTDAFKSTKTYRDEEERPTCLICLEDDPEMVDQFVEIPGCGHLYHKECILPWLRSKKECPTCRGKFRAGFSRELSKRIKRREGRLTEMGVLKKRRRRSTAVIEPVTGEGREWREQVNAQAFYVRM